MQGSLVLYPVGGPAEGDRLFTLISYLRFGPELFFVLSGWLLFSIQATRAETSRMYWARRFARIWPLWLVFTVLTYAGVALHWSFVPAGSGLQLDASEVAIAGLASALFLGWLSSATWNIPAGGWSIQSEMAHYGLFWRLRKATPAVLMGTVLIGFGTWAIARFIEDAATGSAQLLAQAWIRLGLFGTWPFFVAGGLAYLWSSGRVKFGWRDGVGGALVCFVGWFVPLPFGRIVEAAVVTVLLLMTAIGLRRFRITSASTATLGRTSYFIYFAHFWIISISVLLLKGVAATNLPEGSFAAWVVIFGALLAWALLASWALSRLSWVYLESPFIERARTVGRR